MEKIVSFCRLSKHFDNIQNNYLEAYMRTRSGAGASVSSGANFQARVGAYLITSRLCATPSAILGDETFQYLSFETTEAVDDINVVFSDGAAVYIQAKATLSYSINAGGELRSVLEQFCNQETQAGAKLLLVTSSRASKKVINDLRAALNAFHTASNAAFFRDQPKALREIITQIRSAIRDVSVGSGKAYSEEAADELIRKMSVVVLDIEMSDPLEHAVILNLNSKGCIAAEAVWGKIISDCVGHSKNRRTLSAENLVEQYGKYLSSPEETKEEIFHSFFKIEERGDGLRAGRDVFLCDLPAARGPLPKGLAVVETYRFDEDCNERLRFSDQTVTFGDGFEAKLLLRSATYDGLLRMLEKRPDLIGDREVHFCPINSDEDFEDGPCAKIYAERLDQAFQNNPTPLKCVICGKAVSTNNTQIVELEPMEKPTVGTCHDACLEPSSRVLGSIQNEFFSSHDELVNFDVEAWSQAIEGGQMAFHNADILAGGNKPVIAWGGDTLEGPPGDYVVEVSLVGGGREIVTKRNGVHRFDLDRAKAFCAQLGQMFKDARTQGDPYCYTDQSKGFGPRSRLLELFGAKEAIIPVENVRHRRFDARFAARYSRPGQWYAPLFYLRSLDTGDVFSIEKTIFLLSDPMNLAAHLRNWEDIGLVAEDYELPILATDTEFDNFMKWCMGNDTAVVVNPMFNPSTGDLVSGYPVQSIDEIAPQ